MKEGGAEKHRDRGGQSEREIERVRHTESPREIIKRKEGGKKGIGPCTIYRPIVICTAYRSAGAEPRSTLQDPGGNHLPRTRGVTVGAGGPQTPAYSSPRTPDPVKRRTK